ncbi:SPOC domain-like protein [Meira miltonrushii]|uniref:ATP-dependent DNA helicase II subunit 2 n=1 Tax=Meira miltonrushii TaxID=1280837 RepID=A0A316VFY7_9BASI|nr:SPOC domain-like protein [Meira miltonrushii]PWN36529.1 SPOC domain-like protein [Meira miltonrushii]
MSLARTLTTFCIDVSPSMGTTRVITEEIVTRDGFGGNGQTRKREISDLDWTLEFVSKKVQNSILSGLKTAKVHLASFGSSLTENTLLKGNPKLPGYRGVNEFVLPEQPTLHTLELVRSLRAAKKDEDPFPADPMDALVAAISSICDKAVSGTTDTWTRTIYMITNAMGEMNTDGWIDVQNRMIEQKISLKVIGVDFDDAEIGFEQEDKPKIKARNEAFWHEFAEELPGSGVASAARVIAEASLPAVHLQTSAPFNTSLSFGDPTMRSESDEVMDISVKVYKATTQARPLSQKKLSKVAQDSAAARRESARQDAASSQMQPTSTPNYRKRPSDESGNDVTYGVQLTKKYFIKEDLDNVEGGINAAEPLPEGAELTFDRAYKLGSTLVAINDDLERKQDTRAGIEIIQFNHKSLYQRHYHMGETWFVFASDGNSRAELQMSSFIHAMWQQEKYAVVRFVRRDGGEPKLGILSAQIRQDDLGFNFECMFLVEAPFREDLKRFTFPPLDRVINRDGQELREHSSLPSHEMQENMDNLIDSMDLMDAAEDEVGEPMPWFQCDTSYNPAIHTIKDAVSWRVFHPEDKALPKPHQEVTKYLTPPEKVVKRSTPLLEKCRELFDLQYVPTSAARRLASRQNEQRRDPNVDEDGAPKEIDLGGVMDEEVAAESALQGETQQSDIGPGEIDARVHVKNTAGDQAEPEEGSEKSRDIVFDGENPLADFKKKLGITEYKVEDVMDAMSRFVTVTITDSFGSNDYAQARDLLIAFREQAIEYEESLRFNTFLRTLKKRVLDTNGKGRSRSDFWDNFVRGRDDMSLIRNDEAMGEETGVNAKEASEFINL